MLDRYTEQLLDEPIAAALVVQGLLDEHTQRVRQNVGALIQSRLQGLSFGLHDAQYQLRASIDGLLIATKVTETRNITLRIIKVMEDWSHVPVVKELLDDWTYTDKTLPVQIAKYAIANYGVLLPFLKELRQTDPDAAEQLSKFARDRAGQKKEVRTNEDIAEQLTCELLDGIPENTPQADL